MEQTSRVHYDELATFSQKEWDYLLRQLRPRRTNLPHSGRLNSETCVWRLQHHTIPFAITPEGVVLGNLRGTPVHVIIMREFGSDPDSPHQVRCIIPSPLPLRRAVRALHG
jgi:hypothetical protein